MVIKKIQSPYDKSPFFDGDCNFSITNKGGMSNVFGKSYPKTYDMPPFCGNRKVSVAIQWWGCVEWKLNFFWSPFHTSPLSIGDQKIWSPLNSGGV